MTEYREQIDRITGVVGDQTDLIAQIKSALDGKAAGGGGDIETCSLRSLNNYGNSGEYHATVYQDGTIKTVTGVWDKNTTNSDIVTNVVCGTVFCIDITSNTVRNIVVDGGVNLLAKSGYIAVFVSPTENGAIGKLVVSSEIE